MPSESKLRMPCSRPCDGCFRLRISVRPCLNAVQMDCRLFCAPFLMPEVEPSTINNWLVHTAMFYPVFYYLSMSVTGPVLFVYPSYALMPGARPMTVFFSCGVIMHIYKYPHHRAPKIVLTKNGKHQTKQSLFKPSRLRLNAPFSKPSPRKVWKVWIILSPGQVVRIFVLALCDWMISEIKNDKRRRKTAGDVSSEGESSRATPTLPCMSRDSHQCRSHPFLAYTSNFFLQRRSTDALSLGVWKGIPHKLLQ